MTKMVMSIPFSVYDHLMIGGNHLASTLASVGCVPNEQHDDDQVLHQHGMLCADLWVAWRAIMDLRDATDGTPPPTAQAEPTDEP
jgi:hypothetical protein